MRPALQGNLSDAVPGVIFYQFSLFLHCFSTVFRLLQPWECAHGDLKSHCGGSLELRLWYLLDRLTAHEGRNSITAQALCVKYQSQPQIGRKTVANRSQIGPKSHQIDELVHVAEHARHHFEVVLPDLMHKNQPNTAQKAVQIRNYRNSEENKRRRNGENQSKIIQKLHRVERQHF